jgi:hypothetical protein
MGRDGLMSDRLNVTHDRFGTPHRAIIATGGVTGLLVLAGLQVAEIVALGAVWYGGYARSRTIEDGLLGEAVRIAFEPGGIAFETVGRGLFGRAEPSEATADTQPYRVVVPVANPTTQRRLLLLAAATARAHADEGEPELVAVHVTEARPSPTGTSSRIDWTNNGTS